jgi:mannose-6-phosphate isomerase-like protein (cupin superfamily)
MGDVSLAGADFQAWMSFEGALEGFDDECGRSLLYGWATAARGAEIEVPSSGAAFCFVHEGVATIQDGEVAWSLVAEQWCALGSGFRAQLGPHTRIAVFQKIGFTGLRAMGGPLEELGRLRYIDGCSDTLLACPPLLGDPCLNHLHFPPGTAQTQHTHPSARLGIVVRGAGTCLTPAGESKLRPGLIFSIPQGGVHSFHTAGDSMDVVAYHPDSDWGPTDTDHPMVNRTWVNGEKIDNTRGEHAAAEVIGR